jgi:hypothetical protein
MKFELFNAQDEVVVSADVQGVGKWWLDDGPVIYKGDTSLLEWYKTPASGEIVASVFHTAARKHSLRYKCDTPQILPD